MSYIHVLKTGRKIFANTLFLGIEATRSRHASMHCILDTQERKYVYSMCYHNTPPLKERKSDIRKIFLLHCKCSQKIYTILPTSIHKRNKVVLRGYRPNTYVTTCTSPYFSLQSVLSPSCDMVVARSMVLLFSFCGSSRWSVSR